jgi:hypothetical protein
MKTEYIAAEIEDILGIRRSRIQLYIDQGVVHPFDESRAKGSKHRFSPGNIFEIALAMYITGTGLSMEVARHILSVIRIDYAEHLELKRAQGGDSIYVALEFKGKGDQCPEVTVKPHRSGSSGVFYVTDKDYPHIILINISSIKNAIVEKL